MEDLNRVTVLDRVDALVEDRASEYDAPERHFTRVAGMWQALFGWPVRPQDVAMAMVCIKQAREFHAHKEDNLADIEGYAECIRRIEGTNDQPGRTPV